MTTPSDSPITKTPEEFKEEYTSNAKKIHEFYEKKADNKSDFEFLWEHELDSYEVDAKGWVIDRLIPTKSVGIWTGKRGTFKTFLILNAVFSICGEKDFLGRFATEKGKIIYLDKENGVEIMRERKNMIKNGLGLEEPLDVGFICFSTLKIDKLRDIIKLEELIQKERPTLLVVDTYRRGISFEENDAGKVSELFVDTLRPLVEKYDMSIILIHHDRKGGEGGDEMDMIRGSSDLANYADFILKNERKGKKIILKQLKMRSCPEHKPVEISIDTDEESFIKFWSEGDYEKRTKDDQCSEILYLWIVKKKIDSFSTKEAKEHAFTQGIKKTNFQYGLNQLVDKGIVEKEQHGRYKVLQQQKL